MSGLEQYRGAAALLRREHPLVLNITNYVAMNLSANVLLAAGASPLMSFYTAEMEDIVPKCGAVVINIGCLDERIEECALKAAGIAGRLGIPWVLDPVGVGASRKRKEICLNLVRECHPWIIRANASEVVCLQALLGEGKEVDAGKGVDSATSGEEAVQAASSLARLSGAVVSMSGEKDLITDGKKTTRISGGRTVMREVTAMGCSASALTGAFAALCKDRTGAMDAACAAMAVMSAAGEAATSALPGTFVPAFIDSLRCIGCERFDRKALGLYLVTNRSASGGRDIVDIVLEAVKGGATMVQLREKDISTEEFIALGKRLKKALEGSGVPFVINDRVDVALECDACGVHIGQSDMPYEAARRLLGPDKIIGLSVENMQQVMEANALDVDYIGVSPVYATPTKTDTAAPFGLDGLREAVQKSIHPAVAIGGMNENTAAGVLQTGVDGIAVVSAIMGAPSPLEAARRLADLLQAAHRPQR